MARSYPEMLTICSSYVKWLGNAFMVFCRTPPGSCVADLAAPPGREPLNDAWLAGVRPYCAAREAAEAPPPAGACFDRVCRD